MKPTLREYLSIFVALMAILACGIGVGYLVGERNGRREALAGLPDPAKKPAKGSWQEHTLERLTKQLRLTPDQRQRVDDEIRRTSSDITASRDHALAEYYRHLLTLHERILPHLDAEQQAEIEADKKKLQQTIESRF